MRISEYSDALSVMMKEAESSLHHVMVTQGGSDIPQEHHISGKENAGRTVKTLKARILSMLMMALVCVLLATMIQ